jgi:hypothetical protein
MTSVTIREKSRVANLLSVAGHDRGPRTSGLHFAAQSGFITAETPAFIERSRPLSKLNERFAPAWPPFDCPSADRVHEAASCERISSMRNILIAFAVRQIGGSCSKSCSEGIHDFPCTPMYSHVLLRVLWGVQKIYTWMLVMTSAAPNKLSAKLRHKDSALARKLKFK